jgi:TolB-like protein
MAEERAEIPKPETAYVLIIDRVESKSRADAQTKLIPDLDDIVGQSTRFRVADAGGKLRRLRIGDAMALVFFNSGPEAAMECAVETAMGLKAHPEVKVRIGIHSGALNRMVDLDQQKDDDAIAVAQRVMTSGDAGHILLSKRTALELAPMAHWNTHLYEIGDAEWKNGEKISLVNFHSDWAGNPAEPSQIKRKRAIAGRQEKLHSLGRKLGVAAMSLSILAIAAGIYLYATGRMHIEPATVPPLPDKSVAVLPLVDLSSARDQEYFCDGISQETAEALAQVDSLRVIARNSSFAFKGKTTDAREIGRRLNVATILEGTLQREGDHVRLTTQLINAQNAAQISSSTIDREVKDAPALPDEMAKAVARALKIKSASVPGVRRELNAQAYDLFLQGLFFDNRDSEEDLRRSIELFQLALGSDSRLGRAWSGIAQDWISLGDSHVKPLDAYPRAESAATKALAIDDRDAEAHAYLGETRRVLSWDVKGEEAALKRALEINPSFVAAHVEMSILQGMLGNPGGQLDELATAARLDPLSPNIASLQVSAFVANDRFDDAFNAAKRTMEIDPDYIYFEPALALVYREQGKLKEALEIYERLEQTRNQPTAGLAITYARLGRNDDARRVVNQLVDRANRYYFPGEQIAAVYAALGDNDNAFLWLNRAIDEHSPTLAQIAFAREYRALRSDPRFNEVLSRIGIDPAKFR